MAPLQAPVTSEMGHFGLTGIFWAWAVLGPDGGKILRKLWDWGPCSWAAAAGLELEPAASGTHLLQLPHFYPTSSGGPVVSHFRVAGNVEGAGRELFERLRAKGLQPGSLPEAQG